MALGAVALAVVLSTAGAATFLTSTGDRAARLLAASSTAWVVREEIETHQMALAQTALRLARLETPVPVMERALEELSAIHPLLERLWVFDASGKVVAQTAPGTKAPLDSDPSQERRAAMAQEPYRYVGPSTTEGSVRIALGQGIRQGKEVPSHYLGAELLPTRISRLLEASEDATQVSLALTHADGQVLFGTQPQTEGHYRGEVGHGLTIWIQYPTAAGPGALIGVLVSSVLAFLVGGGILFFLARSHARTRA